jgi:hypothetical protein
MGLGTPPAASLSHPNQGARPGRYRTCFAYSRSLTAMQIAVEEKQNVRDSARKKHIFILVVKMILKTKMLSIIGILVLFICLVFLFKMTYKETPNPPLAIENNEYEKLPYFSNKHYYQIFTSKNPQFSMLIPPKYELNTLMEKSSGKIYDLVNGKSKIEVRILDLYGLTNVKATPRKAYSYNLYSDLSMKQSYSEYIKAIKASNINEVYIESGIKKLNENLLIYYQSKDSTSISTGTIIRYNFLQNGYSIGVLGYVFELGKYQEIINSLNSFSFSN